MRAALVLAVLAPLGLSLPSKGVSGARATLDWLRECRADPGAVHRLRRDAVVGVTSSIVGG